MGNLHTRRTACRSTWLTEVDGADKRVKCLFIMGDPELARAEVRGDELWLPCEDDYAHLPMKTRSLCQWALKHVKFDYLFKCDDDSYVALDRLLQVPSGLDYCGRYMSNCKVPYANGGAGYLLSRRAAKVIAKRMAEETGPEDVLVGQHLAEAGITLVHDARFAECPPVYNALGHIRDPAFHKGEWITYHRLEARRMLQLHKDCQASGQPELAVLFCCHRLDALARANLRTPRQYNPTVPIHIIENDRPTKRDGWRNVDQVLCQWYLANRPPGRRFALIESDMLCTMTLRDHYAATWDADLSAAHIVQPGPPAAEAISGVRRRHWYWFREVGHLPENMRRSAMGVVPLAGIMFSRRALDAIAPVVCRPEMDNVFCELRIGTAAAWLGLTVVETGPHAKRTITVGPLNANACKQPGLYHKVKNPLTRERNPALDRPWGLASI